MYLLLLFSSNFEQNTDILQVLVHLFQAKRLFSTNFFVLLCPRNNAIACILRSMAHDGQQFENKFLGH